MNPKEFARLMGVHKSETPNKRQSQAVDANTHNDMKNKNKTRSLKQSTNSGDSELNTNNQSVVTPDMLAGYEAKRISDNDSIYAPSPRYSFKTFEGQSTNSLKELYQQNQAIPDALKCVKGEDDDFEGFGLDIRTFVYSSFFILLCAAIWLKLNDVV